MLLHCICRFCLTKFENPNQLFVISCENNFDIALASIFNKEIQPEFHHLYKICGPCGLKLLEFHNFYLSVLGNEDRLLDIVFNEKLETPPNHSLVEPSIEIKPEQLIIGHEIEISGNFSILPEEDIEMSNDSELFKNESTSSTETCDFALSSSSICNNSIEEFDKKPPKMIYSHFYPQPMEVEPIKVEEKRIKTRCNDCGVYVLNISQHRRCVHDYTAHQKCEECNTVFPNRLKLLMHRYYKHVPPRYQCQYCDKRVRTKGLLREHIYQKHYEGVYLYHCDYCDFKFNYRTSMVIHQKRLHPKEYEIAKNHRIAKRYRP